MTEIEKKELLHDFFLFFRNHGEELIGITVEELVHIYLEQYKILENDTKRKSN